MTEPMIQAAGVIIIHPKTRDVLLILQRQGKYWGFPKGHCEPGETSEQTALREIREEVGLELELLPDFSYTTEYHVPLKRYRERNMLSHTTQQTIRRVRKQIVFFAAYYNNSDIVTDPKEVMETAWCSQTTAQEKIKFKNLIAALDATHSWLSSVYTESPKK